MHCEVTEIVNPSTLYRYDYQNIANFNIEHKDSIVYMEAKKQKEHKQVKILIVLTCLSSLLLKYQENIWPNINHEVWIVFIVDVVIFCQYPRFSIERADWYTYACLFVCLICVSIGFHPIAIKVS